MKNLIFNENHIVEDYTVVLSSRNYNHYGQIKNIQNIISNCNLNAANELSFDVYKYCNDIEESLWDDIVDLKLIWVKELDEYYEIRIKNTDSAKSNIKSITAKSLCEAELSQTYLYNFECNTENDILRDDYVITKFYDPFNPNGSLLNRVLSKIPHYTIGHVDLSLRDLQRSFSVNDKTIYDFLTSDCSEQFDCLFLFDSKTRTISAYDLYTFCNDCGERGAFIDICPKCGSTSLAYYGEDTTIFVNKENLTESIDLEVDTDSVKNCFKLKAGDDNITSAAISLNPNGSPYIYYITDEQKEDMSEDLVKKIDNYDKTYASNMNSYTNLIEKMYETIDDIIYNTSKMMPNINSGNTDTSNTQAALLNESYLSPISLNNVTKATSTATVNSAIKNYAKSFIKSGYFNVEVVSGDFTFSSKEDSYSFGFWKGQLKVTNYSDENDIALTETINIKVDNDYKNFLEQKLKKTLTANDKTGSNYDVLSITNIDTFKDELTHYCLNRLTSFFDAIQGAIDVLVEQGQGENKSAFYSIYSTYREKLDACQNEIDKRSANIGQLTATQKSLEKDIAEIQSVLNFEKYLGDELYKEFCSYKREQTYSNSNYISDGLDNAGVIKKAQEFIDIAKKELITSSTYQHKISSTLYNLLLIKEFQPLVDKFKLGNWIRIQVDDTIFRLMLIGFKIDFSSLQTISVTFSDVTKTKDGYNDITSILSQAKDMSGSYSYVSKQASQGENAGQTLNKLREEGLNTALYSIKNADSQEVVLDKFGITCRNYDDISDTYGQEELKIIHNLLVFTDDGWKTARSAIGKQKITIDGVTTYKYGVNSDFVLSGCIVAGNIYSANYSSASKKGTQINLNDGTFTFADGALIWDGKSLKIGGYANSDELNDLSDGLSNGTTIIDGRCVQTGSIVSNNYNGNRTTFPITNTAGSILKISDGTFNFGGGAITWDNKTLRLSNKAKISWSSVENTPTIPTDTGQLSNSAGYVTQSSVDYTTTIAKNSIITEYLTAKYINALGITASNIDVNCLTGKTIYGTNIAGSNIYGSTIVSDNGSGTITTITGGCIQTSSATITGGSFDVTTSGDQSCNIRMHYRNIHCGIGAFGLKVTDGNLEENGLCDAIVQLSDIGYYNKNSGTTARLRRDGSVEATTGLIWGNMSVGGNLAVSGTKNRVVNTENYGKILMSAYETPTPMFGDIGEGVTDDTGTCYIYIDDMFSETIDTKSTYQVFLQAYSPGNLYVAERTPSYFVVKGNSNMSFGWEIKALQRDYDFVRMEKYNCPNEPDIKADVLGETYSYLESLIYFDNEL